MTGVIKRYMVCRWDYNQDRHFFSKETGEEVTLYRAMLDPERHTYQFAEDVLEARRQLNRDVPDVKSKYRAHAVRLDISIKVSAYGRPTFKPYKRTKHPPEKVGGWIKGPVKKRKRTPSGEKTESEDS